MRGFALYGGMIVAAAMLFSVVRSTGETLAAPPAQGIGHAVIVSVSVSMLFQSLLALAVIMVVARLIGLLFNLLGQTAVIGEVVGGIILGPSFLGRISPHLTAHLLPIDDMPFLGVYAQLGVIHYLFLIGLELDLAIISKSGHATIAISHASILRLAPFVLGSVLALSICPMVSTREVPFTAFALFMGASMSVTAFAVLARILTDLRSQRAGWVRLQ
jgi:Kef-type K+ transport system membrane component KefB